jgi:arylformamidase
MSLIDITRPLRPDLAVWPGDTPYSHRWVMRRDQGASVNVAAITLSVHAGTHTDAPLHFIDDGAPTLELPLDAYIGPATVVEVDKTGPILPADLAIAGLHQVQRLLVRTPSSRLPHYEWSEHIAFLAPETAEWLGRQPLLLFGTDAPSVDPLDSKSLDAHHILHHHGVAILENLWLLHAPSGDYELIALPLSLPVDGSPVRAVLRPRG